MIRSLTRKLLGSAAAAVDRAATAAVSAQAARQRRTSQRPHSDRVRALERLAERFRDVPLDSFFAEPVLIDPEFRELHAPGAARRVYDLAWPSGYIPAESEVSARYASALENRTAVARCFSSAEGRPVAILIHGYMAGSFAFEQRVWPLALFESLGFDVVLYTLPFHGLRARRGSGSVPEFPGEDPRVNIEGFRQATFELRCLIGWLRQRGHRSVGAIGMSLGGYTAALLATVEPGLGFVVPIIPLSSLADFASEQGSLGPLPEEAAQQHALLQSIYRCVSPTARPSLLDPKRALVIAAKADRITPAVHARRLAVHLRAPLHSFYGGHLLQLGRGAAFERVAELLRDLHPAT